jgi:hypothetical protein
MKRRIGVFLLATLFIVPACKKTEKPGAGVASLSSDSAAVYVAGGLFVQDPVTGKQILYAICWKNGVPTALATNYRSFGTCVALEGNDVYVGGSTSTATTFDQATYWKNGHPVTMTDGSTNAQVYGLAINGQDVYAAGFTTDNSGFPVATCWKNGVAITLAPGGFYSVANGIAISGNDVYVVGEFMNGHLDSATVIVWKNGVTQAFTDYPFSYATSVVAAGNDLYVGGTSTSGNGWSNAATIWKDDLLDWEVVYPTLTQVNSFALSGNDIYAAGNLTIPGGAPAAAWWKNGTVLPLSGAVDSSFASGIAINGRDIYIAGGTVDYSYQNNNQAFCWKNGVPFTLKNSVVAPVKNGTDSTGLYAYGIAVRSNQDVTAP